MVFYDGEIRILYIKVDAIYRPIACLTSNPIEEDVEMLETTTRSANGWRTSVPTNQGYNIAFDGLQIITSDTENTDKLSYDSLKLIKRNRELIEWKIADDAENFVDEGFGYITRISEANDVGEFLSFSGEIVGYGEPSFSRGDGDLWMNGEGILFQNATAMVFN